jgi:putative hydrolase of the HAD superfamily
LSLRAVLLDALGTLVRLEPPAPALRARLREVGIDVDQRTAERAMGAEIAYYLEHHMEGRDRESLGRLRDRCAAELGAVLGVEGPRVRAPMLAALRFVPFPDVPPALRELRRRGLRLVVASNWDCSLPDWMEGAGLLGLLDGTASSAVAGEAKPAPAVFRRALEIAGARPDEALHVGDSLDGDVEGARAAGVRPLLVVRDGEPPAGVEAIRSLAELPSLV